MKARNSPTYIDGIRKPKQGEKITVRVKRSGTPQDFNFYSSVPIAQRNMASQRIMRSRVQDSDIDTYVKNTNHVTIHSDSQRFSAIKKFLFADAPQIAWYAASVIALLLLTVLFVAFMYARTHVN